MTWSIWKYEIFLIYSPYLSPESEICGFFCEVKSVVYLSLPRKLILGTGVFLVIINTIIPEYSAFSNEISWHLIIPEWKQHFTSCRMIFTPCLSGRRGVVVACISPSVCLSVHLSVRLFVRKLYLVRTITRHRFELESPNLHQTCIMGYSQLILKMEVIDLDVQCHFGHFDSEF